MDKLTFLIQWNQKDKSLTWSGTPWGLYTALQEHFNITVVDMQVPNTLKESIYKMFRKNDISFERTKVCGKFAVKNIGNDNAPIFQFAENVFDTSLRPTYIYQDLSVDYIDYMRKNKPDVFALSGFVHNTPDSFKKRMVYQNNYYKICAGVFCMGRWLAEDFVKRCGMPIDRVHPVGGGINLDRNLIDMHHKQGNKILFVGRDFERKGGNIVLEAFRLLRQRKADAELYMAGPTVNPLPEGMDGFYYVGPTSYRETADLFNRCDVFCMPSYFEAYGIVFIEALTFGLPCIGRRCYEMQYFIDEGETGLLIDKDDPDELASHMLTLLTDRSYTKHVIDKSDWYLEHYNWKRVAKDISDIIKHDLKHNKCV